jgi:hypothetical protein
MDRFCVSIGSSWPIMPQSVPLLLHGLDIDAVGPNVGTGDALLDGLHSCNPVSMLLTHTWMWQSG